jgi:hypothetical protein
MAAEAYPVAFIVTKPFFISSCIVCIEYRLALCMNLWQQSRPTNTASPVSFDMRPRMETKNVSPSMYTESGFPFRSLISSILSAFWPAYVERLSRSPSKAAKGHCAKQYFHQSRSARPRHMSPSLKLYVYNRYLSPHKK